MKINRITIKRIALIMTVMVMATMIYAQPGGGGGQGQGGAPPGAGAPIDGEAGMLLMGIAAYAYRILRGKDELK
jgi:hypothetical protein